MIIDFHNHYYPGAYLHELERGNTNARVERDAQDRMLVHYPGDYNVVAPGHRDLEERIRAMDEAGVDMHAFCLTAPGVHIESRDRGIELARLVNDGAVTISTRRSSTGWSRSSSAIRASTCRRMRWRCSV